MAVPLSTSIVPVNLSEEDAYDKLSAHLNEDELKKLRKALQLYIYWKEGKKVARRTKPELTGEGTTARVDFGTTPGTYDPEEKRMYERHLDYDDDKNEYVVSYLYGRARQPHIFRGSQVTWRVSAKKKAIWKALESDFAQALKPVSATAIKQNLAKIKDTIASIEKTGRSLAAMSALISVIGTGTSMMTFYDQAGFMGKPEAIVGAVPVYSVQHLERAKSDRKLKSRAIGDVFLAHQKGNKDVMRLDLTLDGEFKYLYLWYLIALQQQGTADIKNVNTTNIQEITAGSMGVSEPEKKSDKILNYEVHKTFPIITRNHILLNMYLQTIEWHQSVEDGKNIIKVHLLFRKYFPTGAYKVFQQVTDENGNTIGGSGLELAEKYGNQKRWMEFTIDAVWKMIRMYGEIYGRMLIGDDGQKKHVIDQQAVSSMSKLVTSYSGKFLGII